MKSVVMTVTKLGLLITTGGNWIEAESWLQRHSRWCQGSCMTLCTCAERTLLGADKHSGEGKVVMQQGALSVTHFLSYI